MFNENDKVKFNIELGGNLYPIVEKSINRKIYEHINYKLLNVIWHKVDDKVKWNVSDEIEYEYLYEE